MFLRLGRAIIRIDNVLHVSKLLENQLFIKLRGNDGMTFEYPDREQRDEVFNKICNKLEEEK